jgi:hypothetical protein
MARPQLERLIEAKRAADAAGNTEDAEYLDGRIRELRAQQTDQRTSEQVPPDDMTRGSARFMGMNIEGGPLRSAEQRELIRRGFEERGEIIGN